MYLEKKSLNEEQTLLFLTSLKTFYFFTPIGKQTIFSKNFQLPPEFQIFRPLYNDCL